MASVRVAYRFVSDDVDSTKDLLGDAFMSGITGVDKSKSQKLYEAIVNGNDSRANMILATYDDEKSATTAKRNALKENDPRIAEAAEARFNGDASEYKRIAYEVINEGNFTFDDVVWAIGSVYNSLKPKEESSSGTKAQSLYKIEDFFEAYENRDEADMQVVKEEMISAAVKDGKSLDDAEKNFYGKVASQCREEYESGNLTDQEAVRILTNYGGKSDEDAHNKVQYWAFKQDYPEYDLSESAVTEYYAEVARSGISVHVYADYYERQQGCKGVKDANGETISGSRKTQVMVVINSLPITSAQKDALYYLNGWAESKLYEAPWH